MQPSREPRYSLVSLPTKSRRNYPKDYSHFSAQNHMRLYLSMKNPTSIKGCCMTSLKTLSLLPKLKNSLCCGFPLLPFLILLPKAAQLSFLQNKNVGLGAQTYLNTMHSTAPNQCCACLDLMSRHHKHTDARGEGQK